MRIVLTTALLLSVGCSKSDTDSAEPWAPPSASEEWNRDILHTSLAVDMGDMSATASITVATSDSTGMSLDVSGLDVHDVYSPEGQLNWEVTDGRLDIGLFAASEAPQFSVAYSFEDQDNFDGWIDSGSTLIWPYYCGNLFPCHSEPADGMTFSLEVQTDSKDDVVVFPEGVPADAPSYQIAWAVGSYERLDLGATNGGVNLEVWHLAGNEADAIQGTEHLLAAWEWFEDTLGAYPFGDRAGSVEVNWGPGAYGGMEHHPLSHIASGAMSDRKTQIHEAAHGWFGDGLRIACWEDFVLSEGTVTYLTARAIEEVIGEEAGEQTWADYESYLDYAIQHESIEAWPDSCGTVDIIEDGLFSYAPYYKGAWFYRQVAEEVGAEVLDGVLGSFFQRWVGQAATMQDMVEHILDETGFDAMPLADDWLRSFGMPAGR